MGRRSIVDKASTYGAKGPRVHNPMEATIYKFLNVCSVHLICLKKAPIEGNQKKKR